MNKKRQPFSYRYRTRMIKSVICEGSKLINVFPLICVEFSGIPVILKWNLDICDGRDLCSAMSFHSGTISETQASLCTEALWGIGNST